MVFVGENILSVLGSVATTRMKSSSGWKRYYNFLFIRDLGTEFIILKCVSTNIHKLFGKREYLRKEVFSANLKIIS